MKYGMIPEFVGRLPVLVNVNQLTEKDLVRVLTEPKNALVKQYEELFNLYKVCTTLSFSFSSNTKACSSIHTFIHLLLGRDKVH